MTYAATHPLGYSLSNDKTRMNIDWVHRVLSEQSHWAAGISRKIVERSVANSMCFALYAPGGQQVAIARVISDFATFAYLSDVYLEESHRGKGLSKWLVQHILDHPDLQGLRRFALVTTNAHDLYRGCGFVPVHHPERWMERYNAEVYNG